MPRFVYTIGFKLNELSYEDHEAILNAKLEELQERGAEVIDIKSTIGGNFWSGVHVAYLITYDAEAPIELEE